MRKNVPRGTKILLLNDIRTSYDIRISYDI